MVGLQRQLAPSVQVKRERAAPKAAGTPPVQTQSQRPTKNMGSRATHKVALATKVGKKSTSTPDGTRKSFRFRPGTVALREIRKLQKTEGLLIQKAPFARLVREVAGNIKTSFRFGESAIAAIQEAAEAELVSVLSDAHLCAMHANRVTVMHRDLLLARRIRGDSSRL